MSLINTWLAARKERALRKRVEQAVLLVESIGFSVCKIESRSDADYIAWSDGSWRRIGRGKK